MSVLPPSVLSQNDLSTAQRLVEDMKARGKQPSDLNTAGQALLRKFQSSLQTLGYSSYAQYASRVTQPATPVPAPALPASVAQPDAPIPAASLYQEFSRLPIQDFLRRQVSVTLGRGYTWNGKKLTEPTSVTMSVPRYLAEFGIPGAGAAAIGPLSPTGLAGGTIAETGNIAAAELRRRVLARLARPATAVAEHALAPAAESAAERPLLSIAGEPITRARPLTEAEQAVTRTTQAITPQEIAREAAKSTGETNAQIHQRLIAERVGLAPSPPPGGTASQRVVAALRAARPVRAEQEALYSAERAKRIAESAAAGQRVSGQAGYYARLAPLKGELPKADFTPIEFSQVDKDELFDQIAHSPLLSGYSVPQAMRGLENLLTASKVPTETELNLLGRVFGREFVATAMAKRPALTKAADTLAQGSGLLRALMTFWDYSASFRQLIFTAPRYPKQFVASFGPMFKASFSEAAYREVPGEVASRPTFELMERGGLSLPAFSDFGVSQEEIRAAQQLAERIPGLGRFVRASNRAYSAAITRNRADVFDAIIKGVSKNPAVLTDEQLKAVASFVNTATGRGELGRLAPAANLLSSSIFAPRLVASRLSLINPLYYIRLDPIVRKQALLSAAAFYGSVATVLGVAAVAGAKTGNNWRSADFGKIIIPSRGGSAEVVRILPAVFGFGVQTYAGATRFEISGGVLPYIRLIGQLATGQAISTVTGAPKTVRGRPMTRGEILREAIENKFSPIASAVKEFMDKETRPKNQPYSVTEEIVSRVTPMIIQDLYDLTNGGTETLGIAVERWLRLNRKVTSYLP